MIAKAKNFHELNKALVDPNNSYPYHGQDVVE
jgi:hypothetical protein